MHPGASEVQSELTVNNGLEVSIRTKEMPESPE